MSESFPDALSEQITSILRETFPGRVQNAPQTGEIPIPKVTLAEVAARLQLDTAREGGLQADDERALRTLATLNSRILPSRLTPRAVGEFLAQIGLGASPRFCQSFAEAAIFLRMGRSQTAQLAATHRPFQSGPAPNEPSKPISP